MRKLFTAFTVVCSLLFAGAAQAGAARSLPDEFTIKGLKGGSMDEEDFTGKLSVLQFWASWCVGCGEVMGILSPLVAEYKGAQFVPVSVDESVAEARAYFKKQSPAVKALEAKAFLDSEAKLATALKVEALPSVAIVDGKGKVMRSYTGHLSAKQVQEIRKLLANGTK